MASNQHNPHTSTQESLSQDPTGQMGLAPQDSNDEELLQNVLQDIANQTKKEKTLFKQTLRQSGSLTESEYDKPKDVTFNTQPHLEDNASEYNDSSPFLPYQPTKMDVLKESFKWSAIVSLLIFVFSQPKVVDKIAQYVPSRFLTEPGSLNMWGTLFVALLGGAIYFALFQWVL